MNQKDLAAAFEGLTESLGTVDALLTALTNRTAAHELVVAAVLRRQDGDTLRAVTVDVMEMLQKLGDEGVENAMRGVWRTAGFDWPSGE